VRNFKLYRRKQLIDNNFGESQKRDTLGRSMNERDFDDNTYNEMIPEQDENVTNEPTEGQYSVSLNPNMRQSLPFGYSNKDVDHYQELFNEWAQSFN
jgi:hypothetical protein